MYPEGNDFGHGVLKASILRLGNVGGNGGREGWESQRIVFAHQIEASSLACQYICHGASKSQQE